jgi:protease-4
MRTKYTFALVGFLLFSQAYGSDDPRRIPLPAEVFYFRPAATVFGSEAAWNNPAGLARSGMAGFQVMADYHAGDYAKSWGTAVYREGTVTAFRHIDNPEGTDYDEWLTAIGLRIGPTMAIGASYRYFREGPDAYNKRHFWNLGFASQTTGSLALAAVFSNLNRGRVDGVRSAIEQQYSVGYRPFGQMLTLSTDMFLSTNDNFDAADFRYHAELVATNGLYLSASFDSDRSFQIGVRANLLKYFIGSQSTFDKNGHDGRTTLFVGATNMKQPSLIREPKRCLDLSVNGRLSENPPQPVFGQKSTPFVTLIESVYRGAEDPTISTMKLSLDRLALGFGQAQELRDALAYFKSRGKRIICHLSDPNNIGYFVASVADTILIPPVSELRLIGLRAELTFWAGTLDKLGAKIELLRVGEYKTAAETYSREASSEENRKELNRLLDDLYDQLVSTIAQGRGLEPDSVRRIIDQGPFTSEEALRYGLVDGLSYRDRVSSDYLAGLPSISFQRYLSDTLTNDNWKPQPTIAIVVAEGEIAMDSGGDNWLNRPEGVRPAEMNRALEQVRLNPDISGVVLRIDSPGGWALAGEEIHRAVTRLAESKPLVVSMANVAASGGYYIATPARRMYVDPASIVGSIGIYGGKADLSGLYEKIRLGKELYTRGRYAGMLTNVRPFTDDEREKYQSHLQAFYDHFVDLVATSRGITRDSVDALGRGRTWTGREAVACGLADQTGGIKQALDCVAGEAGVDGYRVELYPTRRPWFILPGGSLWTRLLGFLTGGDNPSDIELPPLPLSEETSILARMPFDLTIE